MVLSVIYTFEADLDVKIANSVQKYVMKFSGIEAVPDWPRIWPEDNLSLGQVSGVAVDSSNNVHVFHRGSRVYDDRFDCCTVALVRKLMVVKSVVSVRLSWSSC